MTHERKTEVFKELFDSCIELQIGKAKDYASDSDALSNFKSQDAEALGLTSFQKWGVYFGKQAMSIMNAIGKNPNMPSTTSEPIEERIHDAIIYLVLLKCLLEDAKNDSTNNGLNEKKVQEKPKSQIKVEITKKLILQKFKNN
jgi:predicted phage tail protein